MNNFTRHELVLLNNALNEILHYQKIAEFEFHARTGSTIAEAETLLKKIGQILEII
jgi:hypothetical protein